MSLPFRRTKLFLILIYFLFSQKHTTCLTYVCEVNSVCRVKENICYDIQLKFCVFFIIYLNFKPSNTYDEDCPTNGWKSSFNKNQQDAVFLNFILVNKSTGFGQTLSIIRSLNPLCTAVGICHTVSLPETCGVVYQNKFEKWCILLAFIIRIYQDARSSECQNVEHPLLYWFLGQNTWSIQRLSAHSMFLFQRLVVDIQNFTFSNARNLLQDSY